MNMKLLPEQERPYERFLEYGPDALTDAELLAIILKNGTRTSSALDLAREILSRGQGNLLNLYELSIEDLRQIPGIGYVKAIQLKAIAELSGRIAKTASGYQLKMKDPSSIADYYMESMRHLTEEHLYCAYFDNRQSFLGDQLLSIGSSNMSMVPVRELYVKAVKRNATQFVLLHNHPGGDPTPSQEDIEITAKIHEGAGLLGLALLDHIIIGDTCYYSFCEQGLI